MPDDHSKSVPPLPIPNRTVKRLRADDSADPCVKVGHRQALIPPSPLAAWSSDGAWAFDPVEALARALLASEALPKPSGLHKKVQKSSDVFGKTQEVVS